MIKSVLLCVSIMGSHHNVGFSGEVNLIQQIV